MRRAFLIGAGATKAQYPEAPLANDFFRRLYTKSRPLFEEIGRSVGATDLIHKNIEDVMKSVEKLDEPYQKGFQYSLYKAIALLLTETTKSTRSDIERSWSKAAELTTFKAMILSESLQPNDIFLTLNYDLYLDREIISRFGKVYYGKYMGEGGVVIPDNNPYLSSEEKYAIYHLHGSLNWVLDRIHDKIRVYPGAIDPTYGVSGPNLFIIPPGKKDIHPVIQLIWQESEEKLLQCDELVIIGCSLDQRDTELISLIKKFVNAKGVNKLKIVYYETPDQPSPIKNYHDLFGSEPRYYEHGFFYNPPPGVNEGVLPFIFNE